MKGWPVVRALMLVCGMALLAWPIVAVTSQSGVVQSESAEALELGSGNTLEASVDLKTSHPFQRFRAAIGEHELVLTEDKSQGVLPFKVNEGEAILELMIHWTEEVPRGAVELLLMPEGLPERKVVFWSEGEEKTEEVVVLSWDEQYFVEEEE